MPEEMVALEAAHHRVLARDVAARRTQPPQAMSAMDGYAVRAADAAKVQRAAESDRRGRGRPAVRPRDWPGRSRAHLHRRRDPRWRRRRRDPGRHGRRRQFHHHHGSSTPRAQCPPRRRRFQRGRRAAVSRHPPHRSRPLAGRQHELSGAAGAAAAEACAACHRRRAGHARPDARPRPDRLFQRLCAARAGAGRRRRHRRSRGRRRHRGGDHRRHPPGARSRAPTSW